MLAGLIHGHLDTPNPNPRQIQLEITGFLTARKVEMHVLLHVLMDWPTVANVLCQAPGFMAELWSMLAEAQETQNVPIALINQKREEVEKMLAEKNMTKCMPVPPRCSISSAHQCECVDCTFDISAIVGFTLGRVQPLRRRDRIRRGIHGEANT